MQRASLSLWLLLQRLNASILPPVMFHVLTEAGNLGGGDRSEANGAPTSAEHAVSGRQSLICSKHLCSFKKEPMSDPKHLEIPKPWYVANSLCLPIFTY